MPGKGSAASGIMIVAEAPGEQEDRFGEPLVGRSGQILNQCLARAGVSRSDVYCTNVVKDRPHDQWCRSCNAILQEDCGQMQCDLQPVNWNRNPTSAELKACWPYLEDEIKTVKPKVILLLGAYAVFQFTGSKAITRARGKLLAPKKGIDVGDAKLMASFHPAYALPNRGGQAIADQITADIEMAAVMAGIKDVDPSLPKHEPNILLPGHTKEAFDEQLAKIEDCSLISLDLEWTAASESKNTMTWPWSAGSDLLTCSLAGYTDDKIITSVAFPTSSLTSKGLAKFVATHRVGGHNLISDSIYLKSLDIDFTPAFDTMAELWHLDEDAPRSLEVLTSNKARIPADYKHTNALVKVRPADDDIEAWTKLLMRNCDDVYGTLVVHDVQREEINALSGYKDNVNSKYEWEKEILSRSPRQNLLKLYTNVTLPRIRLAANMSYVGAPIDVPELSNLLATKEASMTELIKDLQVKVTDKVSDSVSARLQNIITEQELSSVNSASQLEYGKFKTLLNNPTKLRALLNSIVHVEGGRPDLLESTDKEELSRYQDQYPLLGDVREYRHYVKLLGTYLRPWLDMLEVQDDATLRAIYGLWTSTGRASARSERGGSLHQMPREKWMRKIIRAPEGYKLIVCDLSMIELRMAAWLANERHMQQLFNDGIDLHTATAAYVNIALKEYNMPMHEFWNRMDEFLPLVDKPMRDKAKPVNFGLLYMQQPGGFIDYARISYGISFTQAEAQLAYNGFHQLYPDLKAYFESAQRWYNRGWAISPFGLIRRHLMTPPEACNHPIQSGAGTILALSSISSDMEISKRKLDGIIFGEVHDSILAYAKDECADEFGATIQRNMENAPTHWLGVNLSDIPVKIKADLKISQSWSD